MMMLVVKIEVMPYHRMFNVKVLFLKQTFRLVFSFKPNGTSFLCIPYIFKPVEIIRLRSKHILKFYIFPEKEVIIKKK